MGCGHLRCHRWHFRNFQVVVGATAACRCRHRCRLGAATAVAWQHLSSLPQSHALERSVVGADGTVSPLTVASHLPTLSPPQHLVKALGVRAEKTHSRDWY